MRTGQPKPPLRTEDLLLQTLPKSERDHLTSVAQATGKTPQQLIRGCFTAHKADVWKLLTDIDFVQLTLFQFHRFVLTLFLADYLCDLVREAMTS